METHNPSNSDGAPYCPGRFVLSKERPVPGQFSPELFAAERAAADGDSSAQLRLGKAYHRGDGVIRNLPEALRWYMRAAEHQNPDAAYLLAKMYLEGTGVEKDNATAIKWFRMAASQKHPGAMNALGNIYALGKGAPKDLRMAATWFELAAQCGHSNAQLVFALMLRDGRGVTTDRETARFWLAKAVKNLKDDEKKKIALTVLGELTEGEEAPKKLARPSPASGSNAA